LLGDYGDMAGVHSGIWPIYQYWDSTFLANIYGFDRVYINSICPPHILIL